MPSNKFILQHMQSIVQHGSLPRLHCSVLLLFLLKHSWFIYSVMLVSGIQQSDSVIHICVYTCVLFHVLFHCGFIIEYWILNSSLCYSRTLLFNFSLQFHYISMIDLWLPTCLISVYSLSSSRSDLNPYPKSYSWSSWSD